MSAVRNRPRPPGLVSRSEASRCDHWEASPVIRVHIESTTPSDHGFVFTRLGELIRAAGDILCSTDEDGATPLARPTRARRSLRTPGGETRPVGGGPRRLDRRGSPENNVDRPTPIRGGAACSDQVRAKGDGFRRTRVRRCPSPASAGGWHAEIASAPACLGYSRHAPEW